MDDMETTRHRLKEFLRSKTNDDISTDITGLITSAIRDSNPEHSLEDIKHVIIELGLSSNLDALSVISLLIESSLPGAQELLELTAECSRVGEVTLAIQEVMGRLTVRFSVEDENVTEDDEEREATGETPETSSIPESPDVPNFPPNDQVIRLLTLYSQVIPRVQPRRKTAKETLANLLSGISKLINLSASKMDAKESGDSFLSFSSIVQASNQWSQTQAQDDMEKAEINTYLLNLLIEVIYSLSQNFDFNLAKEKLHAIFPRIGRKKAKKDVPLHPVIDACNAVLTDLACKWRQLTQNLRPGSLHLLAYGWAIFAPQLSSSPERILLTAINDALSTRQRGVDECHFILLSLLYPNGSADAETPAHQWDPEPILPLITTLTYYACGSPNIHIRLVAFRCIGALLVRLPPLLHMQVLADLLTSPSTPPMRVSGVALLKSAVLSALESPAPSPFASPDMLQKFGNIVLRSDPPDLFTRPVSLEDFDKMDEWKRLVETLSFYYVLLLRDVNNRTGVRDHSRMQNVERDLVKPLQSQIDAWAKEGGSSMSMASLSIALDRISGGLETIKP